MPLADPFRLIWTPFLKKLDGTMHQAIGLVCPTVLGSGGTFTLRMGGRRETRHTLDLLRYVSEVRDQNLPITYLWMVPRPKRPVRVSVTWKTPFGKAYRAAMLLTPARPTTVHAIFKTHLDLGYTHRIGDVIQLYQTRFMERLLENLDATAGRPDGKRFVWTLSTWLLEQCLDPAGVAPEHLRKLEKYIRDGSVVWGLMPFTTHSEFFGLEEMCRSLYAARRLAERFGRPVPTAAKMTDVPAHTVALPQAFSSAGGNFFQIGVNPESMPPDLPPLFWWKLPDERRMLCHYRGTYGTPLLPPEDWRWNHWLAVQITSDNVGPQSLWTVDRLDWIGQHFDYPVCRTGRLEDFADAVIRDHGSELPEIEKEVTDWWIHGIGSMADKTAMARIDKERLPAAETLASLARLCANGSDAAGGLSAADVREAYQQLALFTEHTWGDHVMDARKLLPKGNRYTSDLFGSAKPQPPVDRWEASWRDKAAFADRAHELIDTLEGQATQAFSAAATGAVSRGPASSTPRGGRYTGIALFNSLNWARGGLVRVSAKELPAGEFELIDSTTGAHVLYEREGDEIAFIAPLVPACGYLVLEARPAMRRSRGGAYADWHERALTLHTDEYTLQFHTAGGMARWHDRARSSQWCSDAVEHPMGTYLYEMAGGERLREFARKVHTNSYADTAGYFQRHEYDGMSQIGPVGGGHAKVTQHITPLYARVTVEAACPERKPPHRRSGDVKRYRSTFTVYRGQRDLHVRVELFDKRPTYAAEAGYAFFPFSGDEPVVLIDRITSQVNAANDFAGRVNAAHMAVGRGVRIEHAHAGVNFYPLHAPLVGFGRPGLYQFDDRAKYKTGVLYSTLFMNGWGTNFAQWQSGNFACDYVLRPTGNDAWDGGLSRGGAEVYRPLVASVVHTPPVDAARSLLSVEPSRYVQVVTIKPAEFERGLMIRLWNADPDPVQATVRLPKVGRTNTAWVCDLLERRKQKLAVASDGTAKLRMRPNEVVTVVVQ